MLRCASSVAFRRARVFSGKHIAEPTKHVGAGRSCDPVAVAAAVIAAAPHNPKSVLFCTIDFLSAQLDISICSRCILSLTAITLVS